MRNFDNNKLLGENGFVENNNTPINSDPVAPNTQSIYSPPNKTNPLLIAIIVFLLLIITGGGAIIFTKYLYSPKLEANLTSQQPLVTQPATGNEKPSTASSFSNLTNQAPVDETANWETYTDQEIGITLQYPMGLYTVQSDQIIRSGGIAMPSFSLTPTRQLNDQKPLAVTYKITISVKPWPQNSGNDISKVFGHGPVINYIEDILVNKPIKETEIGGTKAYQVDDLPIGQTGVTSDILLFKGKNLYEILIEPYQQNGDVIKNKELINQILSTFKFFDLNRLSNADQTAVRNLINNFYSALTKQDGKVLFGLMTPPITAGEKGDYSWLTGADLGKDSFYRVFLRIRISNPQITDTQRVDDNTFVVRINDQSQGYSNADPVGWSPLIDRNSITITIVNINGQYLVDKFDDTSNTTGSGNAGAPKYSGFGQ